MPMHSPTPITLPNIIPLVKRSTGPETVREAVRHDGGDVLASLAGGRVGAADGLELVRLGLWGYGVDCAVEAGAVKGELAGCGGVGDAAVLDRGVSGRVGRVGARVRVSVGDGVGVRGG